ncbi:condensation domain-containing protein, partial [Streptomyces polyrhachis]
MAGIWQEVLGLEDPVGVYDNFFALGGDSILSLQVVFRAKQRGLYLSVKQLFQHQSVAELAPVVQRQDVRRIEAQQGLVTGPVELTPIQRWFFAQDFAHPHHVNQSMVMEVDDALTPEQWRQVVGLLLEQHDGLRSRFFQEAGEWRAELAGMPEEVPWEVHDLSVVASGEREDRLLEIAGQAQAGLDLAQAPLIRAVLFTGLDHPQPSG